MENDVIAVPLIDRIRQGGPLPAAMCFEVANWVRPLQGAEATQDFVQVLPHLIDALRVTASTLSRAADERQQATGSYASPDADQQLWLRAVGVAIHETAFCIVKASTTEQRVRELLGSAQDITTAARLLPWRAWAPQAVLAWRSLALMFSKVNEFELAWGEHRAATGAVRAYLDEPDLPPDVRQVLEDIHQQLWLAEVGTGCRELEWHLSVGAALNVDDEDADLDALVRSLTPINRAIASAHRSLELTRRVAETRVLGMTPLPGSILHRGSFRQPGAMGARACLYKFVLCHVMASAQQIPIEGTAPWGEQAAGALAEFLRFYELLDDPRDEEMSDEQRVPISPDHLRYLVQHSLFLALLFPGRERPGKRHDPPPLAQERLDDQTLTALSEQLLTWTENGVRRRANANAIGSSVSILFNRAVESIRQLHSPGAASYVSWRRRYPMLDRYHANPGRAEVVEVALSRSDPNYKRLDAPFT